MRLADPVSLCAAKGAFLYTREGRRIFDGISSWWLITHGHGRPEIVEAIAAQAARLEQVVFSNFTHEPAEELAEALSQFLPKHLNRLFFSDNGSTAVEIAMKMAYQYMAQTGSPERRKFVAFANAYHGDTCGAMSVSAEGAFTQPYRGMQFEVLRVSQGRSLSDSIEVWVRGFEETMATQAHEVCAVLLEPLIQGAGGMIMWPVEAVQRVFDIAKQHNALMIFDEVMTGFGRTGTMFAFEQTARVPDFLCLSKGLTGGFLPMGLTVTTEQVFESFLDESSERMFFHGHSFTGNALSCAAALENLRLFSDPKFREETLKIEMAHIQGLAKLKEKFRVRETRVCGAIGVLELEGNFSYADDFSRTVHNRMLEKDIFLRPLGNVIYLMPPFCSEAQDIVASWEALGAVLGALESVE